MDAGICLPVCITCVCVDGIETLFGSRFVNVIGLIFARLDLRCVYYSLVEFVMECL